MLEPLTFACTFSNGCSATVKIDMVKLERAEHIHKALQMKWNCTEDERIAIAPEYVAWMHTVMCEVARKINKRITYAYRLTDTAILKAFRYQPDGTFEELKPPFQP